MKSTAAGDVEFRLHTVCKITLLPELRFCLKAKKPHRHSPFGLDEGCRCGTFTKRDMAGPLDCIVGRSTQFEHGCGSAYR